MKLKVALVFTLLVLASLISFSNRCKQTCDGRNMIVMTAKQCPTAAEPKIASYQTEAAGTSLLRIAVTL